MAYHQHSSQVPFPEMQGLPFPTGSGAPLNGVAVLPRAPPTYASHNIQHKRQGPPTPPRRRSSSFGQQHTHQAVAAAGALSNRMTSSATSSPIPVPVPQHGHGQYNASAYPPPQHAYSCPQEGAAPMQYPHIDPRVLPPDAYSPEFQHTSHTRTVQTPPPQFAHMPHAHQAAQPHGCPPGPPGLPPVRRPPPTQQRQRGAGSSHVGDMFPPPTRPSAPMESSSMAATPDSGSGSRHFSRSNSQESLCVSAPVQAGPMRMTSEEKDMPPSYTADNTPPSDVPRARDAADDRSVWMNRLDALTQRHLDVSADKMLDSEQRQSMVSFLEQQIALCYKHL